MMKISARGWRRDHGAKEVAFADLANAERDDDDLDAFRGLTAYMRILQPQFRPAGADLSREDSDLIQQRVRVSVGSVLNLNLNGRYLIQCDITKSDAAKMFYLLHASDTLDQIIATLSALRAKRAGG